eukprot:CAMPEP_0177393010 /NCGR_PEP_ID=MMETSP0368-20130122/54710_1 /TAXON_ID=447022 ORGANISM="Scrippsiella hangoei-like, Strain SHHI-4" /NCGR_SAMPLE_ID=MMETSP0368 /ASSEMBLY_ACC=CAM_ASM_000363 /LENGTH=63 /DNA_ID=CAMNT_0018859139 /DNA_START=428 /DNA_END=615 /DNA_ORIENTATION=+
MQGPAVVCGTCPRQMRDGGSPKTLEVRSNEAFVSRADGIHKSIDQKSICASVTSKNLARGIGG